MRSFLFLMALTLFGAGCASTPPVNQSAVSVKDAEAWLNQYCSKFDVEKSSSRALFGDLVMRSNTREFKGQYPASIHFEKNGTFIMEVTNIVGGTMMQLTGTSTGIDILVPSKPEYNRRGITHYLGLEIPVLAQLLHGDLPCPRGKPQVQVEGSTMVLQTPNWKWVFERATDAEGMIPVKVRLVPMISNSKIAAEQTILLTIEDWDRNEAFAKKVVVKSFDGELKWIWRSRDLR